MDNDNKERFVTVLVGIADYYDKSLSETTIALYWHGLKKYDLKAVEKAFFNHSQSPDIGKFMPKVADIVLMLDGNAADSAYLAWTKVESAVKAIGSYSDVAFDDWIIHCVITDMGGWPLLCKKGDKEWPFVAKEFENRYRGYHMKREIVKYPQLLIGTAGAHNRGGNFAIDPPILVGDKTKAKAVIAGGLDHVAISMVQSDEMPGEIKAKQLGHNNG